MQNKRLGKNKRHLRIRVKIFGQSEVPRLVVYRSLKNLTAQLVDDLNHKTLFSLSTLDQEVKSKFPHGGNVKAAQYFGEVFSRKAQEKGFKKIVFDRGGYLYHGRVEAFAQSLRKGGLQF